jgi:hypothetical protein
MDVYPHSGWTLIEYVNDMNPNRVLDVGCGFNRFKGKINNLIGIDPYNDAADVKISLEQYDGPSVDVALCLGSINFGDEETIDHQIAILDGIWTERSIFRVNPGLPHLWANQKEWDGITWYPWTKDKVYNIAKEYKYNVDRFDIEQTIQGHNRYYFEFSK